MYLTIALLTSQYIITPEKPGGVIHGMVIPRQLGKRYKYKLIKTLPIFSWAGFFLFSAGIKNISYSSTGKINIKPVCAGLLRA